MFNESYEWRNDTSAQLSLLIYDVCVWTEIARYVSVRHRESCLRVNFALYVFIFIIKTDVDNVLSYVNTSSDNNCDISNAMAHKMYSVFVSYVIPCNLVTWVVCQWRLRLAQQKVDF